MMEPRGVLKKWLDWKIWFPFNEEGLLFDSNFMGADGLGISLKYEGRSIDAIQYRSDLRALVIALPASWYALTFLSRLVNLELLSLGNYDKAINIERSEKLKTLQLSWLKKSILPASGTLSMERMELHKFNGKNQTIGALPHYPNLTELNLMQSSVTDLSGLTTNYPKLKQLSLSHCRNLDSILGACSPEISSLTITSCKKVMDWFELQRCSNLQELIIDNCGEIKSIEFLNKLSNLKNVRILKTPISDGRLEGISLLESGVVWPVKKHYSHKHLIRKNLVELLPE